MNVFDMTDRELLNAYQKADTYDPDICAEICERVGMGNEWAAANAEQFEDIVNAAFEILKEA